MESKKKIKSSAFHLHRLSCDNIQAILKKLNFKAATRTMQTNSEITKLMEKIQKIDAHLKKIMDIDQEKKEIMMMTVEWRSKILNLVVDKHTMKNFPDGIYAELMKEYRLYSKEADAYLAECKIAQEIAMRKMYASSWCCKPS